MIDPAKTLQLYLSLYTHFNTLKYDAIKSNGRIRYSAKSVLEKRRDRKLITFFSNVADDPRKMASILVANFAYGNDYPFTDTDIALANYTKWRKNRESLYRIFSTDIDTIQQVCEDRSLTFVQTTQSLNDQLPVMFELYLSGKINIETVCILDTITPFLESWRKTFPTWDKRILRIQKLSSFVQVPQDKYLKLVQDYFYPQIKEDQKEENEQVQ